MHIYKTFSLIFLMLAIAGCEITNGVHEYQPIANKIKTKSVTQNDVLVLSHGRSSDRPIVYFANVAAHGNAYAGNEKLIQTLVEETVKVGGEVMLVLNKEINTGNTVGTYSGGLMMTSQIKTPSLYGLAGVFAKVQLGLNVENDGNIAYVTSGTAADKVGLKEGMKILALNGRFFSSRQIMIEEVSVKTPGDVVTVEYLDLENKKQSTQLILEAPLAKG